MNEFSSLIVGAAYGIVVFVSVLGWMKYKKRRSMRKDDERQGKLFAQVEPKSKPNTKEVAMSTHS